MAGSPPPPPPSLLYAQQLSSASSSLSLDDLALVAPDYDEQDPMSPQSVFPRVRQKLREEASSSVTGAAAAAAATGPGVLSGAAGMEAADQSTDNLSLSQPSPVAVAAAAAATKKRAARPLPEIPQTVRIYRSDGRLAPAPSACSVSHLNPSTFKPQTPTGALPNAAPGGAERLRRRRRAALRLL